MSTKYASKIVSTVMAFIMLATLMFASIPTKSATASAAYNRDAAVSWANSDNKDDGKLYGSSAGRWCTTYVTKALRAGGIDVPIYNSNASLATWLRGHTDLWEIRPKEQLEKGDFLFLNKGAPIPDDLNIGFMNHVVLITGQSTYSAWNAERINKNFSWFSGAWKYEKGVHIKTTDGPSTHTREQIYWDNTYTGNVDARNYEKWTMMFSDARDFTITATRTSGDVGLRLILLDDKGNELTRVDGSEIASLSGNRSAGNYAVLVQPVSGSGSYSLRMVKSIIESVVCPGSIVGWKSEFFNNRDLSKPRIACRDEVNLDFGWEFNSPTPMVSADNFSARFTRTMNFSAGDHTFYLAGDDGIRLFIDGNKLIDQWFDHGFTEYPATINLTEGLHTIVAEYYEHTGGATVKLRLDEDPFPSVSTVVTPTSINVGGTSTAIVSLNNVPTEGYTAAEFTCTYDPALVETSNIIANTDLFGADAVTAINGPQNDSFIVAIAGSNGNKATTSGSVFTFTLTGLAAGETLIECKARVSNGSNTLTDILFTPATLKVGNSDGTLAGQVLACKPVTIRLNNTNFGPFLPDGKFNLLAPVGTYTVIASASGFLNAQGTTTLTAGNTTPMSTISLFAGDIDNDGVIGQLDAMTIGMNYNIATPTAADLNCDSIINVLDLELLARNYRQVGPIAWQ